MVASRDEKRREKARRRLQRLELVGSAQVMSASEMIRGLLAPGPLRVRHGFVHLHHSAAGVDYSDRRVPPPAERPPATRLLSPTGSALRLEMILLGVAQSRRAGSEFRNDLPLTPRYDSKLGAAWVNLITTPAQHASKGRHLATPMDKRKRTIESALKSLAAVGLVTFPRWSDARGKREAFLLMDERATAPATTAMTYRVPRAKEETFTLPVEFLRNGWVHVLEDSEIALLLMVHCGIGSLPDSNGWIAIPAATRLLDYGISRDNFSAAHPILEEMGLLEVQSVGRHWDGQVVDFESEGPSLHRLRPVAGGLDQRGYSVARAALERLSRH